MSDFLIFRHDIKLLSLLILSFMKITSYHKFSDSMIFILKKKIKNNNSLIFKLVFFNDFDSMLLSERDGPLVDRPLPRLRTRVRVQAIYSEKINLFVFRATDL